MDDKHSQGQLSWRFPRRRELAPAPLAPVAQRQRPLAVILLALQQERADLLRSGRRRQDLARGPD